MGGMVQTGSVFLQAKPEEYRCRNEIDDVVGASYDNALFASTSCRVFQVEWSSECPDSTQPGDYANCASDKNLINNDTLCSACDDYVYSPNNTFTQTVSTRFQQPF